MHAYPCVNSQTCALRISSDGCVDTVTGTDTMASTRTGRQKKSYLFPSPWLTEFQARYRVYIQRELSIATRPSDQTTHGQTCKKRRICRHLSLKTPRLLRVAPQHHPSSFSSAAAFLLLRRKFSFWRNKTPLTSCEAARPCLFSWTSPTIFKRTSASV